MTALVNNICFICGKEGSDTVDHIPPKGIFHPKYRNNNLITVPAHRNCNKKFEKDDEYFRDNIVLASCEVNKKAQELFDDKIIHAYQNKKAQGYRRMQVKQLNSVEVHTPTGLYVKTLPIKIFETKRIDAVISRICRGLYYHRFKFILPIKCKIQVDLLKPEAIDLRTRLIGKRQFQVVVPDIFEYVFIGCNENPETNLFFLFFYNCFTFHITTGQIAEEVSKKKLDTKSYDKLEGIRFTEDTLWIPPGKDLYK
jgi:hypothetical protein